MAKLSEKEVKAMAEIVGVPIGEDAAARIATSIGPAFEGFSAISGTLPLDLEPAGFLLVQAAKVLP